MNIDKILPLLKTVNDMVSQVRDLLFCPDGIRITAIHRDDLSYVEYWDGDLMPRIIGLVEEKVEEPIFQQWVFEAVGQIPPSACGEKSIELHTDRDKEDYVDGIQMTIDIFLIKMKEVTNDLIKTTRERHDFNNYLSQLKRAPEELKERLQFHRDNRLSSTGPGAP